MTSEILVSEIPLIFSPPKISFKNRWNQNRNTKFYSMNTYLSRNYTT